RQCKQQSDDVAILVDDGRARVAQLRKQQGRIVTRDFDLAVQCVSRAFERPLQVVYARVDDPPFGPARRDAYLVDGRARYGGAHVDDAIGRRYARYTQPDDFVAEIEAAASAAGRDVEFCDSRIDTRSDAGLGDVRDDVVVTDRSLGKICQVESRDGQRRGLEYGVADARAICHEHVPVRQQHR